MSLLREFPAMEDSPVRIWTTGGYDVSDLTLKDFPYVINICRDSLPWTWVEWCKNNCTEHWAWWFDNNICYVGFIDQQEALLFALIYVGTEG